jgi:outer membrane receptor protein involved in Fe transport
VVDLGSGGSSASAPQHVGDYEQLDAVVGYDFSKAGLWKWAGNPELRFGVNNIFNRMPPEAPNAFPATNADVGDYNGPIGRLVFLEAKYRY